MYQLTILKDLGPLPVGKKGFKEGHSLVACAKCHTEYVILTTSAKKNKTGVCKYCLPTLSLRDPANDGKFNDCHNKSGIYLLYKGPDIVYVGKSTTSIGSSLRHHLRNPTKDFDSVHVYFIANTSNVNVVEPYLIERYKPILNTECNSNDVCTIHITNIDTIIDSELRITLDSI